MASFFNIFHRGLQKSATKIGRTFAAIVGKVKLKTNADFDDLTAALVAADFGVAATQKLVASIREKYDLGTVSANDDLRKILRDEVAAELKKYLRPIHTPDAGTPCVILMTGVNGSGKTTSIGKLAAKLTSEGKKVILGACDTFRAAAVEQLQMWGERTNCAVISAQHGADPASVAFDATSAAVSRNADYLLIDTAGRQQNQSGLMAELAKIKRSISKVLPDAPHEIWLTVDATLGANVLSQAKEFSASCGVTGLVLTKLDGTGKGGMIVALSDGFQLPTFFVGLGEQIDDLQKFDPDAYADALFTGEN